MFFMRILLCSDFGGKIPDIPAILIKSVDFVLLAGDITMGAKSESRTEKNFIKLGEIFPESLPVYWIPGNHDYPYILEPHPWISKNFRLMHNQIFTFNLKDYACPISIVGFGGAKIGMYNNFAFTEDEIYSSLNALFHGIPNQKIFTILLIHDPPFNTALDFTLMKTHVGSESVRKIIEKYQPNLAVAGHIHESIGIERIGRTMAINAGEAKYDHYAIIQVDNFDINVELH
jgi:Icc-related predicted phosphoesterase